MQLRYSVYTLNIYDDSVSNPDSYTCYIEYGVRMFQNTNIKGNEVLVINIVHKYDEYV